jgi:hypothetical protein
MSCIKLTLVQKLALILTFGLGNPKESPVTYNGIFRVFFYFNFILLLNFIFIV